MTITAPSKGMRPSLNRVLDAQQLCCDPYATAIAAGTEVFGIFIGDEHAYNMEADVEHRSISEGCCGSGRIAGIGVSV